MLHFTLAVKNTKKEGGLRGVSKQQNSSGNGLWLMNNTGHEWSQVGTDKKVHKCFFAFFRIENLHDMARKKTGFISLKETAFKNIPMCNI